MPIHEYAVKLAAPVRWILILGIVATVLNTARSMLYLPDAPITNATRGGTSTPTASSTKAVDINALVNLHLFGKPARQQGTVPQSVANAQATPLTTGAKGRFCGIGKHLVCSNYRAERSTCAFVYRRRERAWQCRARRGLLTTSAVTARRQARVTGLSSQHIQGP